tara:strand:+ start:1886 stop:2113 length:228 start_codon:yes stop_codon:yes gene_type:complete
MAPDLVNQGLQLIKQASCILEGISNNPGVTSLQFYDALDLAGISCDDERDALYMAAANIEMSLELVDDAANPTIH